MTHVVWCSLTVVRRTTTQRPVVSADATPAMLMMRLLWQRGPAAGDDAAAPMTSELPGPAASSPQRPNTYPHRYQRLDPTRSSAFRSTWITSRNQVTEYFPALSTTAKNSRKRIPPMSYYGTVCDTSLEFSEWKCRLPWLTIYDDADVLTTVRFDREKVAARI